MTSVLVAYESRMGATAEFAEAVGRVLREAGLSVTVRRCAEVETVDDHDADGSGSGWPSARPGCSRAVPAVRTP